MNKNDYLGEYTGELISHREADKRGKIYDRANSSFLFDLNDQASNGLLFIDSNPATISYIADSRFVLCFLEMVLKYVIPLFVFLFLFFYYVMKYAVLNFSKLKRQRLETIKSIR